MSGNTDRDDEVSTLLDHALDRTISWAEIRDLAVEHPVLLTEQARQELERRARESQDLGDEGRAVQITGMRDAFTSWSELSPEVLRTLDVEQPVPDPFKDAVELRERFRSTADPRDAASAARAWREFVGDRNFGALPKGTRTAALFTCCDACGDAYEVTTEPEFLDALFETVGQLINGPIPPETVPGALVRWGKALRLRYWAYDDPADARRALNAFERSYELAPKGDEERALNLCHYAQWLHACAIAARDHLAPLEMGSLSWDQALAIAIAALSTELETAPTAKAAGALAYAFARCLADLGEADSGEEWDVAALTKALELAQHAEAEETLDPLDRLRARALVTRLAGELHRLTGEGDPEEVNRKFLKVLSEAAALSPFDAVGVADAWGRWALHQLRPADAVEALEAGRCAGKEIIRQQVSWQDLEIWLAQPQDLTANLALALVLDGQRKHAVEVLEADRRGLLTAGLHGLHEELRELARAHHPNLTGRLDRAEAKLRAAVLLSADRGLVRRAREEHAAIEAEIQQVVPGYGLSPSYAQIAEIVTDQPLVYLAACETSGLALLIDPATKDVSCELPADLRSDLLLQPLARFLRATGTLTAHGAGVAAGLPTADWPDVLEATADWLGETLLQPLLRITNGATAIRVIPVGHLGLLPLHLARRPDASSATGYRYLLDDRSVSFLPSARFLPKRGGEDDRSSANTWAPIIEARDLSLKGARAETDPIATTLGPRARPLLADEPTRDSVMAVLRGAEVAHVASHGIADSLHPLNSALLVGASERITVRDLLADSGFTPRLVVLSACQSATSGARLPDEAVSLPTALLQAGASAVIGSLWSVLDAPTALLMARFYELWQLEGNDPPEALRLAQIWLRDSPNAEHADRFPSVDLRAARVHPEEAESWRRRSGYKHPDCWAGFVFAGAWTAD